MYNIVLCKKTGKRCTLCKLGFLANIDECPNRIKQSEPETKETPTRQEDPTEGKYSGLLEED